MGVNLPYFTKQEGLDLQRGGQEHILIEGDNYEALTALQYSHQNAVDVIYIDPPYSTGTDLTYRDKFPVTDWTAFMRPRMIQAHSLLKDSGVMLVSIDDGPMRPHLDLMLTDIFGLSNRLPEMIWKGKSGGADANHIRRMHEYVLVFAKNASQFQSTELEREALASEFPHIDQETGQRYWRQPLRQGGNRSRREDSPTLYYPITTPDGGEVYPRFPDGSDGVWRWSPPKFDRELAEGNVEFRRNKKGQLTVEQKMWQTDTKKVYNDSLLPESTRDTRTGTNTLIKMFGSKPFTYPKPVELLEYLINFAGDSDSMVLDFFAGSGTTAHAVAALNTKDGGTRQSILVTNNESNIFYDTTYPRVAKALTGDYHNGKGVPLDGSLVCFKVDSISPFSDNGDIKSDESLMEIMSDKFTGIAAIETGAFTVSDGDDDYTILKSNSDTVLVWTNTWDDDDLEDTIESFSPTIVYLPCESAASYADLSDEWTGIQFRQMPVKYIKTAINSQHYSDQGV